MAKKEINKTCLFCGHDRTHHSDEGICTGDSHTCSCSKYLTKEGFTAQAIGLLNMKFPYPSTDDMNTIEEMVAILANEFRIPLYSNGWDQIIELVVAYLNPGSKENKKITIAKPS